MIHKINSRMKSVRKVLYYSHCCLVKLKLINEFRLQITYLDLKLKEGQEILPESDLKLQKNPSNNYYEIESHFQVKTNRVVYQKKTCTQDLKSLMLFLCSDDRPQMKYHNDRDQYDSQQDELSQKLNSMRHYKLETEDVHDCKKEDTTNSVLNNYSINNYSQKKPSQMIPKNYSTTLQQVSGRQYISLYEYKLNEIRDLKQCSQRDMNDIISTTKSPTYSSTSRRLTSSKIDHIIIKKKQELDNSMKQITPKCSNSVMKNAFFLQKEVKQTTRNNNNFILDDKKEQDEKMKRFIKLEMDCFWDINQRKKKIIFREKNLKRKLALSKQK